MGMHRAFLDAIVAAPDDDAHRLVDADWLDEDGQPHRAEFIRLQCRLDPDRERYDDAAINAGHARVNRLLRSSEPGRTALELLEDRWFDGVCGGLAGAHPAFEWRRGFVETLALHAGLFVRYGRELRRRHPLARKLVVFCLNGWGERLAACPWLAGLREIELACWYSDDDLGAMTRSPHLRSVERVVCWPGGGGQAEALARAPAWPALRELRLVSAFGRHVGWAEAADAAAGRPVASAYAFDQELFPFAGDFYDDWTESIYAGKLPDGTQLIVQETYPTLLDAPSSEEQRRAAPQGIDALAFDPDGTSRPRPYRLLFPDELRWKIDYPSYEEQKRLIAARKEYLRRAVGFEQAFVRVRGFGTDWLGSTERFWDLDGRRDRWGMPDAPGSDPEADRDAASGGNGVQFYDWVRLGSFDLAREGDRETFSKAGRSYGGSFLPW